MSIDQIRKMSARIEKEKFGKVVKEGDYTDAENKRIKKKNPPTNN